MESQLNLSGGLSFSEPSETRLSIHEEVKNVIEDGKLLDSTSTVNTSLETEFKTSPYRWLILFLYTMAGTIVCMFSITLSPVSTNISKAYNVSLL
jgi:hypothetical protein